MEAPQTSCWKYVNQDILKVIATFLNLLDLIHLSQTCKDLRFLIFNYDTIWKCVSTNNKYELSDTYLNQAQTYLSNMFPEIQSLVNWQISNPIGPNMAKCYLVNIANKIYDAIEKGNINYKKLFVDSPNLLLEDSLLTVLFKPFKNFVNETSSQMHWLLNNMIIDFEYENDSINIHSVEINYHDINLVFLPPKMFLLKRNGMFGTLVFVGFNCFYTDDHEGCLYDFIDINDIELLRNFFKILHK